MCESRFSSSIIPAQFLDCRSPEIVLHRCDARGELVTISPVRPEFGGLIRSWNRDTSTYHGGNCSGCKTPLQRVAGIE